MYDIFISVQKTSKVQEKPYIPLSLMQITTMSLPLKSKTCGWRLYIHSISLLICSVKIMKENQLSVNMSFNGLEKGSDFQ